MGEGLRLLGRIDAARESITRALDIASRHRLNQLSFRAEDALRAIETVMVPHRAITVPSTVADVAEAIGRMRAAALAG